MKKSAGLLFLFGVMLSSCKLISPEADEETLEEWLVNNIRVKQVAEIPECATDKSKYEKGKPVELVLTNTTGQSVSYHPLGIYLLHKEGEKWARYEFQIGGIFSIPKRLAADEKFTLQWDQLLPKQGNNMLLREQAPKGKYRFCIPYWMGEETLGLAIGNGQVYFSDIYYPYNYNYFNPFETEKPGQTSVPKKILISNEFEI